MMLPLKDLLEKYGVKITGVIQVGSHYAEEHDEFVRCGMEYYLYVEPCREAFEYLVKKFNPSIVGVNNNIKTGFLGNGTLVNAACGENMGQAVMYVSHQNQGQSNSLLEPGLHTEQHPEVVFDDGEIVQVEKLDNIVGKTNKYDFLVMDVQGAEGLVLRGATETLKTVSAIYTEVNRGQTYKGNMEIEEMDALLSGYGFVRVETFWPSPNWTWGDALYIKKQTNTNEPTPTH